VTNIQLFKSSPTDSADINGYGNTGSTRWALVLGDDTAETGSNTGTNFGLYRFSDAGAYISPALTIIRATGNSTFAGAASFGGTALPTDSMSGNLITGANFNTIGGGYTANVYYTNASNWKYLTNGYGAVIASNGAGGWAFYSAPSGTAGNVATITNTMTVDNAGNLTITGAIATKPGGGTWTAPSDMQLKVRESIAAYTTGLAAITQLQPVTYKYNGKAGLPKDQTFHGLIADDVEIVMPEAVGRAILGARPAMKDGEVDEPGEEYRTFDQTPLLFALINCVKELKAELDILKGEPSPTQIRPVQ
jgi:hypothetical protein